MIEIKEVWEHHNTPPPIINDTGRYIESLPVLAYLGNSGGVMVITAYRFYFADNDNPEEVVWLNPYNDSDSYDVTHWQYLPTIP